MPIGSKTISDIINSTAKTNIHKIYIKFVNFILKEQHSSLDLQPLDSVRLLWKL